MIKSLYRFVLALVAVGLGARSLQGQVKALPFSCEVFSPTASAATLATRFGATNVRTGRVPWGGAEGDLSEGTVIFDTTSDAKLGIYWRDRANKRGPEWVSVRGKSSRWRSPGGITLGMSLQAIERLNTEPFRLVGFGNDASGTVMDWSSGRLEAQNTPTCHVRIRLGPDWDKIDSTRSALINQLKGEAEYSSGHPAMQALDPTVYEMFLQYTTAPAYPQMEPPRP